jgi:peptidoglycan biosynthesis protein MviN/MurJ (putative lipid II flippase)
MRLLMGMVRSQAIAATFTAGFAAAADLYFYGFRYAG